MKRYCIAFLFLTSITLLCSCVGGFARMRLFDDSNIIAGDRMNQIFLCIKNRDHETLKSMFSAQALSKATEIDEKIDNLFLYVHGHIESWERTGAYAGMESRKPGINIGKVYP